MYREEKTFTWDDLEHACEPCMWCEVESPKYCNNCAFKIISYCRNHNVEENRA